MNKSKLTLVLIAVLTVSALGHSQQIRKKIIKGGPELIHENMMMGTACMMIDMDEAQQEKSKALHSALEKDMMAMNADLNVLKAELKKLMIADNPNRSEIKTKIEEMGKLKTQIHKRKIDTHLAVREMLNKEQKIQFDKFSGDCCGENEHIQIIKKHIGEGHECGVECKDGCKPHKMKIMKKCGKGMLDEDITVDVEVEIEEE